MKLSIFILFVSLAIFGYSYRDKLASYISTTKNIPTLAEPPKEDPRNELPPPPPKPALSYRLVTLVSENPGKELADIVGTQYLPQVLSLNRIDDKHLRKDQTIVIPSSFDDAFALSAFPKELPELKEVPKMLLVSQRVQEFGAYEYGTLVRFGGVSTGKKSTPTPSKLYHTNWKGKLVTSTVDDTWIMPWYFNLDNILGVSMHQYELPGYPASHSCVRLSEADAIWAYDWALQWKLSPEDKVLQNGTPVLIFGDYAYGESAPWKKLPENPDAIKVSTQEMNLTLPY